MFWVPRRGTMKSAVRNSSPKALPWLEDVIRARADPKLLVVLTPTEVQTLRRKMNGKGKMDLVTSGGMAPACVCHVRRPGLRREPAKGLTDKPKQPPHSNHLPLMREMGQNQPRFFPFQPPTRS